MPRQLTLIDLLDHLAPQVQKAFLDSIFLITSTVRIKALEAAIQAGNVDGVFEVLDLGPEYFAPLDRALRDAYEVGGDWTMYRFIKQAQKQGAQVRARFDARNLRAENWVRSKSAELISEITEDQRSAVSRHLTRALEQNTAPRTAALELVGRVNRSTGRRQGGIIGLHSNHADAVARAFDGLVSGDPALMRDYLSKGLRNRTFDREVMRAIQEGKAISPNRAREITGKYADRLLRHRGESIARTELLQSLHAVQDEGLDQLVESGKARAEHIEEEWDAAIDLATRPSHAAMDGQKRKHGKPFQTGEGYLMLRPGDRSLGAPAKEIIRCRCRKIVRIDFIASLGVED